MGTLWDDLTRNGHSEQNRFPFTEEPPENSRDLDPRGLGKRRMLKPTGGRRVGRGTVEKPRLRSDGQNSPSVSELASPSSSQVQNESLRQGLISPERTKVRKERHGGFKQACVLL